MRALSLFGVLTAAKLLALAGKKIDFSWWLPFACLGQDALLCLILALLEGTLLRRRPVSASILYGFLVLFAALNVPLLRLFSSPLTRPMLAAAGRTIGDSILYYCTAETLLCIATIIMLGTALPIILTRLRPAPKFMMTAAVTGLLIAALGPVAAGRVETAGLYRNPVFALARPSWLPWAHAGIDIRNSIKTADLIQPSPLRAWRGRAAHRNVVLILLESTGAPWLRPYGGTNDPMPNLTRLSHHSIQCQNAYAVYPESIKGLFSVLCSQHPMVGDDTASYGRIQVPSLAARLKDAGYCTALFHSGRFGYLGMNSVIRERGFDLLADAGTIGGNDESSFGIDEFSTVAKMLCWIDSVPMPDPFFLSYVPIAGHHPYETFRPGPFAGDNEPAHYLNALHEADMALGELFDGLSARGLVKETLFVIMGDHGEAFGQHPGNYGHTFFLYEENLHVPFFVIAPGLLEERIVIEWPVSLIDTAPTILGLLGLDCPPAYQGSSLLEDHSRISYFATDYSLALLGLREGSWKFIYNIETGHGQLFNLSTDPSEEHDLAQSFPDRVRAYREKVLAWKARRGKTTRQKPSAIVAS